MGYIIDNDDKFFTCWMKLCQDHEPFPFVVRDNALNV